MSPTWHILGAGAMGSLLASKLQRAGLAHCLLFRAGARQRDRFELLHEAHRSTVTVTTATVDECGPIERLVVCTKAHQASAAFDAVHTHLRPDAPVILLHNGMGVRERIAAKHADVSLFSATTTEGAYWSETDCLVHAGRGDTLIGGPAAPIAPGWFSEIDRPGVDVVWEPDIDRALWRKLLINCAINPLTALHNCPNGDLWERPTLRYEVAALCEELAAVSRARGYSDLADSVVDNAFAVARATAGNRSSMLRDCEAGRGTEIDYITGYLCEEAARLGVDCPRNFALLAAIRELHDQSQSS